MNTRLKTAWLIRWDFHGLDEVKRLRKHRIKYKIVDVFNARKSFDVMLEYTKNLYRTYLLSLSEKIYLEHYSFGTRRTKKMFGTSIPVFTSYNSDVYRELDITLKEKGIDSREYQQAKERWINYAEYIIVGHNPSLESRKVFNVELEENSNGEKLLRWEEITAQGQRVKKNYKLTN